MGGYLRRIFGRLQDESGIALVFALMTMFTLAIVTSTVLYYSSETSHASSRTDADQQAYSLAEAGLNTAVAKIYGATDPRLTSVLPDGTAQHPATVVPKCSLGANPNETPTCYQSGSVTYYASLDTSGGNTWYWNITSIGTVPVAGVSNVTRKLTRSVGITGSNGTNGNSWTRFYQDATSPCLTLDGVSVPTNFSSKGDICLVNGATVTGSNTNIMAGGHIYVDPPTSENPGSYVNSNWSNESYSYSADSRYATFSSMSSGTITDNLDVSNFGFSLPSSATIQGIVVSIQRKASSQSSSTYLADYTVQLLKSGSASGSNKALTTTKWPTSDGVQNYGSASDLWSTTWSYSNINSSSFGVRIAAKATCSSCSLTASINAVTVTVYATTGATIGTSGSPIALADVGSGCQLSGNTMHSPCGSSDKVYASTIQNDSAASNPNLSMPDIDWDYWWANAEPGPKHFCTNANPGLATNFFDNNASSTNGPDASLSVNGEMAPKNHPYDCEVWDNGVLEGEIKWDGTHNFYIYGTIFVDGNFRFDEDGEIIHYWGRGTLMSSHDDEIDALVCAGGTGNTYSTSCLSNMANWNPSQNMMVLMSECMRGLSACNEYDQGDSSTCSGSPPNCYGGIVPSGFQGILYSKGDCLIHQYFQDSGPVICNTISLPHESYNPTFYSFPSIGNLTDGMSYSDTATATDWTLNVSAQGGG